MKKNERRNHLHKRLASHVWDLFRAFVITSLVVSVLTLLAQLVSFDWSLTGTLAIFLTVAIAITTMAISVVTILERRRLIKTTDATLHRVRETKREAEELLGRDLDPIRRKELVSIM
jgi:low affinity Fe/Cu permease